MITFSNVCYLFITLIAHGIINANSFISHLPLRHWNSDRIPFFPRVSTSLSVSSTENGIAPPSSYDYSTLSLLEHINLNVPSHEHIIPFYFHLLGFGLDPRIALNIKKGDGLIWANCGPSQFHFPFGETAQKIPGSIGLAYDSLENVKRRLLDVSFKGCFDSYEMGKDRGSQREYIKVVDNYGNAFYLRERKGAPSTKLPQPIVSRYDNMTFGDIAINFGKDQTECCGIDYVEFNVRKGSAAKIVQFYETTLDASVNLVNDNGVDVAIVGIGMIDDCGRSEQSLLFRETDEDVPVYDGHHVALYVGNCQEDFDCAFQNLNAAKVVWVNPRFEDKVTSLEGAKELNQFRFKDVVDLETGETIFELEHEIRSIQHKSWPGAVSYMIEYTA